MWYCIHGKSKTITQLEHCDGSKSKPYCKTHGELFMSIPLQFASLYNGMDMSPVHQVWPKPPCKAQWKVEEDEADRRRGEKTTSGNGQAWSLPSPRGQWRTEENGCEIICGAPTTLRSQGIDEGEWEAGLVLVYTLPSCHTNLHVNLRSSMSIPFCSLKIGL